MSRRARAAGFSLIEILVVIALISLLIGLLVVAVGRQGEAGRRADCSARIQELALLLESYRDRHGDYPPARLAELGVKDANPVNEGIEALVLALRAPAWGGRRPDERWLANGDDDSSRAAKAFDGSTALLELVDPWDNPLAYIPAREYSGEFTYRTGAGGAPEDARLRAATNPLTRAPWHADGFQLRSAGPDGSFGTEDDVANFDVETADG